MALESSRGMMEDEELEDGELSGSDTDMKVSRPADQAPVQNLNVGSDDKSYRGSASLPSVPYRNIKNVDSSDDSASDSEEDDGSPWKRKRQKTSNPPRPVSRPTQFMIPDQNKKPKNNIWGAVLQEQTQEAVAKELGIMDMDGLIDMSRQSETYNYVLAKKLMTKSNDEEKQSLDKELEEYMNEDREHVSKEENGHLKRKRPVKERIGEKLEMNYKGRYEITDGDPDDKVADEIAYRLQEPKKDLIERVVKTIGTKKAIELLMETAEVEQNGGLFVMNGTRRRTPGGVYLNLLKNTPSITSAQIKEIFYMRKTRRNMR
ncbi:hypothetical protein GDO81_002474 [Engystomops pustulosus]|uniref:Phosphorylated adapter RNA export protein n=1 Tax=Engystomops pustulosus TaxID=76066 RepID=A0AAV7DKH8_ENGPU|nr:hypothetical protein GDO81_002474 [Engystomops pustulosus]